LSSDIKAWLKELESDSAEEDGLNENGSTDETGSDSSLTGHDAEEVDDVQVIDDVSRTRVAHKRKIKEVIELEDSDEEGEGDVRRMTKRVKRGEPTYTGCGGDKDDERDGDWMPPGQAGPSTLFLHGKHYLLLSSPTFLIS
jgi:hypothetical protein